MNVATHEFNRPPGFASLLGTSPVMQSVFRLIERVGPTEASVLLTGESGSGKELAARSIHEYSARRNGPFVAINCGAIPAGLIEAELFGCEQDGSTAPAGARKHLGALLLGDYRGKDFVFVGKVGTGFSQETLAKLFRKFTPLVRSKSPVADPPRERDVTWLAPRLIAQIAYEEWTDDRKLRQPVYLGLRDDKRPEEVTLPEPQ